MKTTSRSLILLAALAGAGFAIAGCADVNQINHQMGNVDFGRAYQEDFAAQIADPDANYKGPPPASSGARAAIAQKRYQEDSVKEPKVQSTGSVGGGGGGS